MEKTPVLNRKQTRYLNYHKETKIQVIAMEKGERIAYIHPTKGYRGQKKAIKEYRFAMGYK